MSQLPPETPGGDATPPIPPDPGSGRADISPHPGMSGQGWSTQNPAVPAAAAPVAPYDNSALDRSGRDVVAQGLQMKRRNPFAVWLGLPLITLGIYHLVWYYKIHHEMGEFDRRRNVPATGPVLVLIFLGWTVIAPLISYYNCGHRIANAQRAAGLQPSCSGLIGVLLMFVLGLGTWYFQTELNKVHDVYGRDVRAGTAVSLYA
jgi:Domain of unknown function (DUF4234)